MRSKCLEFLYKWINDNKIVMIKKGMVEDLEVFLRTTLADFEAFKSAERMKAVSEGEAPEDEENSQRDSN